MLEQLTNLYPLLEEFMNGNRSALWAIIGVVVGFSLPLLFCGGLAIFFVWSAGAGGGGTLTAGDPLPQQVSGPATGPAVALLEINGLITDGGDASGFPGLLDAVGATPQRLIPQIKAAAADSDVRAFLIKVNSPGGAVVATDEIYHALQTATDKPIVVLMGDVAASGGVYVSMAADHIMANPNTLTGSIGVRLNDILEYGDLLQRLGVNVTTIKAGEYKDIGSGARPLTDEEAAILQAVVDDSYANFIEIVAEGRGLSEAAVREFADGRIFTGEAAVTLGLVDSLGYEQDAIAKAGELGGISGTPRVVRFASPGSVIDQLLSAGASKFVAALRAQLSTATGGLEYR
jgi:protease-4